MKAIIVRVIIIALSFAFTKAENDAGHDGNRLLIGLLELQENHCSTVSLCTVKSSNNVSSISSNGTCCKRCSCDTDCSTLGTCCPDVKLIDTIGEEISGSISEFSDRLKILNSIRIQELLENEIAPNGEQENVVCEEAKAITNILKLDSVGPSNSYFMISDCSKDFTGNMEMAKKCTYEVSLIDHTYSKYEPALFLPVTSLRTNNTYKNIFCFKCNEVEHTTEELSTWRAVAISEQAPLSMLNVSPYGVLRQFYSSRLYRSNLLYIPRADILSLVRRCDPVDIGTCPKDSDKQLANICAKFHLPVIYTNKFTFIRYRNIACFLCNKQDRRSADCADLDTKKDIEVSAELNFPVGEHNHILQYNESDVHALSGTFIKVADGQSQQCSAGFIPDSESGSCRRVICPKLFYPLNGACMPVYSHMENIYLTVMLEVRRVQTLNEDDEAVFYRVLSNIMTRTAKGLFKQFTYGLWKLASGFDFIVASFTTWPAQSTYLDMLSAVFNYLKQLSGLRVRTKVGSVSTSILLAKDTTVVFFGGQLYNRGQKSTPLQPVRQYLGFGQSLAEMRIQCSNFCYRAETGPPEVFFDELSWTYINNNTGFIISWQGITTSSNDRVVVCIDDLYPKLPDVRASYMFDSAGMCRYRDLSILTNNFNLTKGLPEDVRRSNSNVNGTIETLVSLSPNRLFPEPIFFMSMVVIQIIQAQ